MRLACACVLVTLSLVGASGSAPDPFDFFRPDVTISTEHRIRLDAGDPVVSVLNAKDRDIAVFSAIGLPRTVSAERFVAWLQNIAAFRKTSYVVAIRRFSMPPRAEDVQELALDEADLRAVRECHLGKCDLKLSSAEIQTLRTVVARAGEEWKPAVQKAFRDIVLDRVRTYSRRGHAGFAALSDHKRSRSPGPAFSGLLERTPFLAARAPLLPGSVPDEHASAAAQPDSYIYWSTERMGAKSVVSATHVTVLRGDGTTVPEVLVTGKQIFATHYLDASLGVTAFVRDPRTFRTYLVYVNRSDLDLLGGFWGGIARRVIEDRIEADGPALLRDAARKLSSGDPPALCDR
jgi:hypothetical protein